jgi:altronate hydrolase
VTTAIVISTDDNVATALDAIAAGETVRAGASTVTAIDAIPRGHKIALRAISIGARVVKYGSPIGTASAEIAAGAHVHTHNVASARGRGDLAAISRESSVDGPRLAEPRE